MMNKSNGKKDGVELAKVLREGKEFCEAENTLLLISQERSKRSCSGVKIEKACVN